MEKRAEILLSAKSMKFWYIDYTEAKIVVIPQRGSPITGSLESAFSPPGIKASVFDWERWWITSVTDRNHLIVSSGFNADCPNTGPHLPTVYLDQNMWSLIGYALFYPRKVSSEKELLAARRIIELARDDGIILPISAGHLLETTALHTETRYMVGAAAAELSYGWQLRHPLNVLQQEAIEALRNHAHMAYCETEPRPRVTTEPNALWFADTEFGIAPPRLATYNYFIEMLAATGSLVSMLIDPEAIQSTHIPGWVEHHQRITQQFCQLRDASTDQKRAIALRRFWNLQLTTYHAAAMKLGQQHAPMVSNKDLRRIVSHGPMTSLLSELYITRFVDASTRWHENDLVDMLFLSCGAGYCDYVVGERKTINHLRQIRRSQQKSANTFTTLTELVDALRARGSTTANERSATQRA